MYTEVPLTPYYLHQVWQNLWPRGKEEFARLGLNANQGFFLFLRHMAKAATSGALLCDDRPVLVAGIVPDGREHWTFMQASADFDEHAGAIVRCLRKRVNGYTSEPLYVYSVCVHPSTPRFFKAIGFAPDDDYSDETEAGHPLYRFKRSKPCAVAAAVAAQ